ncbi:MAG: PIN domain-containing protein [Anaerolineales bacterium]
MDRHFVDTNIFLRFLTNDSPDQAQVVDQLLVRAELGELQLHTSVLTMAEIVWTLESYYNLKREDVRDQVVAILNTPGLQVEYADIIARAMILYADENIDFVDAYNGIWLQEQGLSSAITFDTKHFQHITGVTARTPTDLG